ncbi:hypothetical protein [Endozoicomonas acroporae]|uniref:hypothetical protein n=1 Tax=Endozoicomonas acroporae TaxID=1701104 RepID=UPI0013D07018|nr:hypothetical protein [Endozoicomonas acroporae]
MIISIILLKFDMAAYAANNALASPEPGSLPESGEGVIPSSQDAAFYAGCPIS